MKQTAKKQVLIYWRLHNILAFGLGLLLTNFPFWDNAIQYPLHVLRFAISIIVLCVTHFQ